MLEIGIQYYINTSPCYHSCHNDIDNDGTTIKLVVNKSYYCSVTLVISRQTIKTFHFMISFHSIRNEVECNLNFCGFVIFENKLKPQSAPILDTLRLAAIRTVMITGM